MVYNILSNAFECSILSAVYLLIGGFIGFVINRSITNKKHEHKKESVYMIIAIILIKTCLLGFVVYICSILLSVISKKYLDFNFDPSRHNHVDALAQNFLTIGILIFFDDRIKTLYYKLLPSNENEKEAS